jgi:hypothetical protein
VPLARLPPASPRHVLSFVHTQRGAVLVAGAAVYELRGNGTLLGTAVLPPPSLPLLLFSLPLTLLYSMAQVAPAREGRAVFTARPPPSY